MADDQQDRPTSIAKGLDGLAQKDTALDRALKLRELYNRAAKQQEHQQSKESDRAQSGTQQGSEMVKEDAPALKPVPSGPMRQIPDRQTYNAKLEKERANSEAKIEEAKKAQEVCKARQQQNRDLDQDRER